MQVLISRRMFDLEWDVLEQIVCFNLQHVKLRLHLLEQYNMRPMACFRPQWQISLSASRQEALRTVLQAAWPQSCWVEASAKPNKLFSPAVIPTVTPSSRDAHVHSQAADQVSAWRSPFSWYPWRGSNTNRLSSLEYHGYHAATQPYASAIFASH